MKQGSFVLTSILTLCTGFNSSALEGVSMLEKKLLESNQEVLSLQQRAESEEALHNSSSSSFYPSLSAVGGYADERRVDPNDTKKGTVGYLEGRLNLFKGFKDINLRKSREASKVIAQLQLEAKKQDLRIELTELLGQMVLLHEKQLILEDEFKITQSQKQMAAKKVSAGLTSGVDNLEFELRESEIEIELKQVHQLHMEAHQNLERIFGQEVKDSEISQIKFSPIQTLNKISGSVNAKNSVSYKLAELNQAQAEFERKNIRSDYLPTLDVGFDIGKLTPTDNSISQTNESKLSVLLTVPLFSGFDTYYKTKSAALLSGAADKLKSQSLKNAFSEINVLQTKVSELNALFQINEKKLNIAQRYFDMTLSEYRRGIKNSPDLVGATERLFSSKKKKIELLKELELLKVRAENYLD